MLWRFLPFRTFANRARNESTSRISHRTASFWSMLLRTQKRCTKPSYEECECPVGHWEWLMCVCVRFWGDTKGIRSKCLPSMLCCSVHASVHRYTLTYTVGRVSNTVLVKGAMDKLCPHWPYPEFSLPFASSYCPWKSSSSPMLYQH